MSLPAIGSTVTLLSDIWDDGDDGHHPPGYLAKRGETLIVRKHGFKAGSLAVAHEDITDNSFTVYEGEWA